MSAEHESLLAAALDVVDATIDLANEVSRPSASSGSLPARPGDTASVQTRSGCIGYKCNVSHRFLDFRNSLTRSAERHGLLVACVAWMSFTAMYLMWSELGSFLFLHAVVLTGVVIHEYECPVEYAGWPGKVFRAFYWLVASTAIVVPLFAPVEITGSALRWISRLIAPGH
jgi:hypothetical protein